MADDPQDVRPNSAEASESAGGSSEPQLVDVETATTAVVRGHVAMTELPAFFDRAFSRLGEVLPARNVQPTGAAFARYFSPPGDTADLEVGFPTDRPIEADGEVTVSSLPSGRVARVVHAGSFEQLGAAWGRLGAWMGEQGLALGETFWEVYLTEPSPDMDPADLRTELNWQVGP